MRCSLLTLLAGVLATILWGPVAAAAEPVEIIHWPPGVEAKMEEALAIKQAAFKESVTMRTAGGRAGVEFDRCMREIAVALTDPALKAALVKAEHSDLRAKLALWALDRELRRVEYDRLAAGYVEVRPLTGHALLQPHGSSAGDASPDKSVMNFGPVMLAPPVAPRKLRRPAPVVVRPLIIAAREIDEARRWPLEYLFFAPPCGAGLDSADSSRSGLARALGAIGHGSSLGMFQRDFAMQMEAWPPDAEGRVNAHVGEAMPVVHGYRSTRAFEVLAMGWGVRSIRDRIEECFEAEFFPTSKMAGVDRQLAEFITWREIAGREWRTPEQRSLAAWVKALPQVVPLVRD